LGPRGRARSGRRGCALGGRSFLEQSSICEVGVSLLLSRI